MRVLVVSPYHGGSHAAWAEGLRRHSRHQLELLTLPARFWKWRMHGGALTLAPGALASARPDAIVATDMLDLSSFMALTRKRLARVPTLLYMHENQLTYPLPADGWLGPMRRQAGERDRHYGFINLVSMLTADRVVFNSAFHRAEVLAALPAFIRHFPDFRPEEVTAAVERRSDVLPIGVDPVSRRGSGQMPPLVVWNQRWEYDKNPESLFAALLEVARRGVAFEVALCGERFGRAPEVFDHGIEALGDRVIQVGWLPRDQYLEILSSASVVVSTSLHEFFGIAVVEAIAAGAVPLLPRRLSYPELLPTEAHAGCLYDSDTELADRLAELLASPATVADRIPGLAAGIATRFAWENVAPRYDRALEQLAGSTDSSGREPR